MALVRCKNCWLEVSAETMTCPRCGTRLRRPVSKLALMLGALLIALGWVSLHHYRGTSWYAPPPPTPDPAAEAKAEAIRRLDFSYNWRRSPVGSPMLIDITLSNKGEHDVKGILVACEHRSDTGTLLDVNRHIYWDVIKTSVTKKIDRFDMGPIRVNASATKCHVEDLAVLQAN